MSAKGSLLALALLAIILGIARSDWSSRLVGKPKTHLSFWNGWTGPDGRVALEMIREFNKENPDIEVTMQRMDWATYYNKLMVAEVDGRGPQVFVIHASTLPRMVRAGFVADASDLYREIPKSDFEPYVLNQVEFDGKMVGLPLDIHPQGMYCNADDLIAAGIVDEHGKARPPRNRSEFVKAIRALKTDARWGFALTLWQNNFQSLIPQFGGRYLDENGNADLANPGNVRALEFLAGLTRDKLVPPPENGLGWVGYRQGKVAIVWDGVYMLGDLKRLDAFHYIGAPLPVIGDRPGTMADSHVLCMQTKLSPKERDAAERFITYFSKNSIQWANAGQVPARKSIRQTPAFRGMQVQYAFSKQVPYVMYPPRTPILFELSQEIQLAVEKVIRGRATAKDALQIADANCQKVIERDRAERRDRP